MMPMTTSSSTSVNAAARADHCRLLAESWLHDGFIVETSVERDLIVYLTRPAH